MEYSLANKKTEDALIDDILRDDTPINATLYDVYSKNLRRAVDKVFYEDNGNGLSDRLRANVTRFAAYKAYHATQQVREQIAKDGDMDKGRMVLHAFNRYQAAEYNTTVSRCRTAKQFEEFSAADNMRLFPNLRWLPSRSANPREQHMLFYNRVWAKDDPFWAQNQPGNLWNCKCDWEETSDPVTDGNPTAPIRHDGLEGNPAHTGEVFTDNANYIRLTSKAGREKVLNLARKMTIKDGQQLYSRKASQIDENGNSIEVFFNSKGVSHFANDMFSDRNVWLKNELTTRLDEVLQSAKLVAYELNCKLEKKPTHRYYLYYETKLADGTPLYISVYQNMVDGEYKFYAVSKTLRETATRV
ncbi:MAG: hypothetical protein ACI30B_07800 [Paludibacteraceae bacterium]